MITARAWSGRRYAVLGLARSGLATVQALLASGASVVAWDENEEAREALLQSSPAFAGEGDHAQHGGGAPSEAKGLSGSEDDTTPSTRPLHRLRRSPSPSKLGEELTIADPLTLDLTGSAGVVVSPGIPINRHPIAAHARAYGVPLIGDIELFAQARAELPPHKVVGITGTNGKSTTTALVHHILKTAGVPSLMGGNIGLPILAQDPLTPNENGVGVYVLELSSYQIDLTFSLDCDVAVLLNITPDHLDRYDGSFEAYARSKFRLFQMQSGGSLALLGRDWLTEGEGGSGPAEGVRVVRLREPSAWGDQSPWPGLPGPHNARNATAAAAVAQELGVSNRTIKLALGSYSSLPHRMERVAERDGILFVNDSKATNAESTAPALAAYPHVHWIVGGRAKAKTLGPCEQHLDHVHAAYTIGEAGPMFARLLDGRVPVTQSHVLDQAVRHAAAAAKPGEVVLLSPACASFDQFRDFEARGEAFRAAVESLA